MAITTFSGIVALRATNFWFPPIRLVLLTRFRMEQFQHHSDPGGRTAAVESTFDPCLLPSLLSAQWYRVALFATTWFIKSLILPACCTMRTCQTLLHSTWRTRSLRVPLIAALTAVYFMISAHSVTSGATRHPSPLLVLAGDRSLVLLFRCHPPALNCVVYWHHLLTYG